MKTDKLRFGVSYCPYAKSGDTDMKYWERDFQTMRKLNFNTLRCFVAWDRIEREEGKLDFSKTDYIFELAEKYGMELILNIGGVFGCHGGIYPPRWLIYDYNCQHIIEDPTRPYTPFGSYRLLCPDDQVFSAKAAEFTVKAVERYKGRRELCGWNVWNEAALDHMCYCPATMLKFRTWLKARYSEDLDRLNREWGTEFPLDFRTWDMVEPGLGAGFRAGGHMARLDWMHFNRDKVEGWVKGVNRLVKERDASGRPTTSNVVVHGAAATDGRRHNAPNLWGQNHDLDIAGFSFYSEKATPSDCSYMLNSVRGSSAAADKSFWILETCAGQMFHQEFYPGDCCDKDFRIASHWLSVLHGCKTILLWKFGGRVTDNQTDFFNLTGWDGGITERAENNAAFAADFMANEKVLLDKSYNADTAILFSQDSYLFNIVDNSLDSYEKAMKSRLGAYQMLRDLRIQIDVISDTRINEGCLSKYRVLVIPWCEIMSRELADRIGEFVKNGGTVIADRMLNIKDENSHIHFQAPGHGLSEVFGGYVNDMLLTAADERIHTAFGDIPLCCHHHAMIHPAEGTEVIGVYKNGTPAVVARRCGKGKTLWFGSDVFFDYRGNACAASAAIVEKSLAEAGVSSEFSVKGDTAGMEFGVMTGIDGKKLYFILNMNSGEREFSLSLSPSGHKFHDMLSTFSCCGESHVRMLPWEVKILG